MIPTEPYRPRVAELLRAAMLIWRRNWKYSFFIAGLFVLPQLVITMFIPERYFLAMLSMQEAMFTMLETGDMMLLVNPPYMGDAMVYSLITLGIPILFLPLSEGAYTYIALQGVQNKPVTITGILEVSLLRFGKYFFTSMVFVLLMIPASFLLFVPAVILAVYCAFYSNAVSLTGRSGFGALRISHEAVRGRWFSALGFLILLAVLGYFLQTTISIILSITGLGMIPVLGIPAAAASYVFFGVLSITQALWFLDRLNRLTASTAAPESADEPDTTENTDANADTDDTAR